MNRLLPLLAVMALVLASVSVAHAQTTTPTVSTVAVTSDPGTDLTYALGDTIEVGLTFDEAVTVTGDPYLLICVGGTNRRASYHSGSTTNELLFRYTVATSRVLSADNPGRKIEPQQTESTPRAAKWDFGRRSEGKRRRPAIHCCCREELGNIERTKEEQIGFQGQSLFAYAGASLVLQRRFKVYEVRRGAWHGSAWPVRYYPAYPRATAAAHPARTVPGAALPTPPGRPAVS